MARGWESKAVEDQIEEGKARRLQAATPELSSEDRAKQEKLQSLNLARSRVLQQLERARHASHREMLLNGLKAIENEIEDLNR